MRFIARLAVVPLVLSAAQLVAACGTAAGPNTAAPLPDLAPSADAGTVSPINLCHAGVQGCACTQEGVTAACGRVDSRDGNYFTCSMGYATCHEGAWGDCVGDHFVTVSAPNVVMTQSGIHTLAQTYPTCTNVCDPRGCLSTLDDPTDVDAAGIVLSSEAGVTLPYGIVDGGTGAGTPNCLGLACSIANCKGGVTTTLSGTVYDPAGNNPLYNANVYIPNLPSIALPSFASGASCDTCSGAGSLSALQATQTDAAGNFTLTNVPTIPNLPVVVQMGKWRREIVLKTITSCQNNTITNNCTAPNPAGCVFRLPRDHSDGYDPVAGTYTKADVPHIAIVTGNADPFDCLLLKTGIDPAEFGDYTSTKRFHYYEADKGGGNTLDPAYGMNVPGSMLWGNLNGPGANMMSYDVILLPCQGGAYDAQASTSITPYQNLVTYTDQGGRAFTTHFSYSWLEYPAGKGYVPAPDNWSTVANWSPTGSSMTSTIDTQDPLLGTVNTSFPKGAVYSQWLQNVNASSAPGQLVIHEGRQDLTTLGANPQTWMTAHDNVYATAPDYTNLYTFNTPLGAAASAQCGRVVYSDFHVSASALVGGGSQCLSNVDCGFTATCSGAKAGAIGSCSEPCGTSADCPNNSFACTGGTAGTCSQTTCTSNAGCGTGRPCVGGVCECTSNADCNGGACAGMTCTPIACTSSAQCGKGACAGGTCNSVSCHKNADCGLGTCGGTGKTGTCSAGTACHSNAACGIGGTCGSGTGSTAGTCSTSAQSCHKNADCDSNSCGSGSGSATGTCANGNTHVCHANTDCDSSSCGTGSGSAAGTCANGGGVTCHKNADCDSNSCGSGSGSATGTCSTSAQTCHKNTDCDSNSCGSGSGSAVGTCAIAGGTACHKNGDCDSNSCGSGTGSTAGTCSTSGQTCHASTQCDSGSCGGGTCSNGTGHACHTSTDCDAGNCGAGTKGTCAIGAGATCHKNADCDSNSCGTGSNGSSKGVCKAGACTTNAQCGTGGTCNLATHLCTAGACSVDASCGTSGGLCTGATCTTPAACSADSACVSSKSCTGATCGAAQACGADSTCTSSGVCAGAKCTTLSCGADASCSVGGLCNGAKCSSPGACAGDAACASSHSCTGAKCSTLACVADATCTVTGSTCNGAKCSTPATCAGDSACPSSHICNGAKCSTPAVCTGDASCPSSGLCTGAKCSTKSCAGDASCTVGALCNGAKCSSSTCNVDTDCPTGTCAGAKCTPPAVCGSNADCGTGGACSGAKCTASACSSSADCGAGSLCGGSCQTATCSQNTDCASGVCAGGVCGCASGENCGGAQTCSGANPGVCGRTCTSNADCAPDFCINGKCGGCSNSSQCHDNAFSVSCGGISSSNYGTCSVSSASQFPEACRQGPLSAQEKALEFMFFDLTSCVSPDNAQPPSISTAFAGYPPATFTQDFVARCGPGTQPVWREFDWQAVIPTGANIILSAQSGVDAAHLLPATALQIADATASTNIGPTGQNFDAAFIDTGPKGTAPFSVANPEVISRNLLRVTITLNPTPDFQQAPTLKTWKIQYDCPASE